MARIRTIKPEFFENELLAALSFVARLTFIGLWTLADRAGRMEYRPIRLKAKLFPYEDVSIEDVIGDLEIAGFVHRYFVQGRPYLEIANFQKHQWPHVKEPQSVIPAPGQPSAGTVQELVEPVGKGREGKEGVYLQPGNSPQPRPVPPPLLHSRRAHLDHVWCGSRFCIPSFVVDDCWQMAADFLTRDVVVDRLFGLAPAWEAALEGKPLDDGKRYVKQRWKAALASMRDAKRHEHEARVYDCRVCNSFHHGHPSEGCKSGHARMQNGKGA